jgi:hypothetical protein
MVVVVVAVLFVAEALLPLLLPPQAETARAAPAIMETAVTFFRMSRIEKLPR